MAGRLETPAGGRPADRWVARGILVACVASLLLTSWIGFRTADAVRRVVVDPLTITQTQGLVTGLWSSNLMLLQTLFMARLPWLERTWGRRTLARRHRLLGYWSFWLMLVHVGFFALQRYLFEPDDAAAAMTRLFLTDPWMLVATIGTVLIVLVVLTSITAAMRSLRYETWHLIHLNAYLGMGLALPHQLASVDFNRPWIAAYWWALFVGTLLAVVAFRVVAPIIRTRRHGIRVVGVTPEAAGAVTVTMAGRDLERLDARAGQYLVWRFLGSPGRTRGHPYSLSAAPAGDRMQITVAAGGDGGVRAAALTPGTRVAVEGPFGSLPDATRHHRRTTLFAAGIGITPLRAMLDHDLAAADTTLVYRVRTADDLMYAAELAGLAAAGLTLVPLIGARRSEFSWLPEGTEGESVQVMTHLVPDLGGSDVFVCGPPRWADVVVRTARAAGVDRRDIHREDFG